ncbi:DUF4760 domain-containing protein [Methylobacterium oryzae]|uniref:DUF4760 domain-containing protein n=1 Tax=Methylobacterium oryzae TaxID=334852 RepID=UPI00130E1488|nr:DUF4760 domain-containing protein [Methylobacterium oryzae]
MKKFTSQPAKALASIKPPFAAIVYVAAATTDTALARGPVTPGLSAANPPAPTSSANGIAGPIATAIAYPIQRLVDFWDYIVAHPSVAGLLTALVAGSIAISSIRATRSVARLRETYNSFSGANWDADVIKARKVFSEVRKECANSPHSISNYFEEKPLVGSAPNQGDRHKDLFKKAFASSKSSSGNATQVDTDYEAERLKHQEAVITLRTILNDYENIALGIKLGILDEDYAYRYYRGTVLRDWEAMSPLVFTYRGKRGNNRLFIEFEGLAHAWENEFSFRTRGRLQFAQKKMTFR